MSRKTLILLFLLFHSFLFAHKTESEVLTVSDDQIIFIKEGTLITNAEKIKIKETSKKQIISKKEKKKSKKEKNNKKLTEKENNRLINQSQTYSPVPSNSSVGAGLYKSIICLHYANDTKLHKKNPKPSLRFSEQKWLFLKLSKTNFIYNLNILHDRNSTSIIKVRPPPFPVLF